MELTTAAKIVSMAVKIGKKIPYLRGGVRTLAAQHVSSHLIQLHHGVVHSMRRLTVFMSKPHWNPDNIAGQANHLCSEMRKSMAALLLLDENDLHCCLKMMSVPTEGGPPELFTWARSQPFDDRENRKPAPLAGQKSSVYSALIRS